MSWNYRVIEFVDPEPWQAIHEVYYDQDKPTSYSEAPAVVMSSDAGSLSWVLERMKEALSKPALAETDFEGD